MKRLILTLALSFIAGCEEHPSPKHDVGEYTRKDGTVVKEHTSYYPDEKPSRRK